MSHTTNGTAHRRPQAPETQPSELIALAKEAGGAATILLVALVLLAIMRANAPF